MSSPCLNAWPNKVGGVGRDDEGGGFWKCTSPIDGNAIMPTIFFLIINATKTTTL
jgi:hypothetical protein